MAVTAHADALAVQGEDILIVGCVFIDVRDGPAGGVALGHQLVVDAGKGLLRQNACQNVGHLGPGGGGGQLAVQCRVQGDALRPQVQEIGHGGRLAICIVGSGACFRTAGAVEAADAGREDNSLSHCQRGVESVCTVRVAHGKPVFIEGGDIGVEGGVCRQIGELTGIGLAADKVIRAVLRRQGGHGQQAQGQQQGEKAFFHGSSFLSQEGMFRSSGTRSST